MRFDRFINKGDRAMTMSNPESPFLPDGSEPGFGEAPRPRRPGGLTAVCVLAIVLGSLGALSSLSGLVGSVARPFAEKSLTPPQLPGGNDEFVKANLESQKKIRLVADRYWGLTAGVGVLNLVVSAGLVVGGIVLLRPNAKARSFLLAVFAVAIAFTIVQVAVAIFMQVKMAPAMAEMMPNAMKASVPKGQAGTEQAAQMAQMGTTMAKVVSGLAIAFCVFLGLVNLVFYAVGARYLCKPHIRALCRPSEADSF
jgi:hypothetical protein